jgi:hypothetical protein
VNPVGGFTFNGQWTGNKGWPGQPSSQGNAFADFLLGTAATTNYAGRETEYQVSSRDWEFYAQDTFQVTSKLTLNSGTRYTLQTPWYVRDNRATFLDLKNNKLALLLRKRETNGNVDEEYPAPTVVVGDPAAEDRPDRRCPNLVGHQ